jgi:hypothetical protein
VDENTFASIEILVKHGKEAIKGLTDPKLTKFALKEQLTKQYQSLFEILMKRSLPLSTNETKDFDREFDRLFDLQQLYLRGSQMAPGNTLAGPIYERSLKEINTTGIYSPSLKANIHKVIKV